MTAAPPAWRRRLALPSVFGATFFELLAYFMLLPMLLLQLNASGVSTAVAGLFAAMAWTGIFLVTPFASAIASRLGRRRSLWLSAAMPVFAVSGFALTDELAIWFVLELLAGMASGLRWIIAEAVVAELAPPERRGRRVGQFETMVAATFILGPALLVVVGAGDMAALPLIIALFALGLLCSSFTPALDESATDGPAAAVGWRGVHRALVAHPLVMLAGFTSGFFESGITSVLPLYGLSLAMPAGQSALLVSASGLGSALLAWPIGALADRLGDGVSRRVLMTACCAMALLATAAMPLVAYASWVVWPTVLLWGGAGGCLYTIAMIDIGTREQGLTLINSTAVLVLTYTFGSMVATSASGVLLQWSPMLAYPVALGSVAFASALVFAASELRQSRSSLGATAGRALH